MKAQFAEPRKDLPLWEDADVIVCGGGPAGVAAAIAAARAGARTHLFEVHGCLGGVWTSGLLTYIFDFDKPGLTEEIRERLDRRDARRGENIDRFVYEPEEMKVLLEEMCLEAGVVVHLQSRVVAAFKEGRRLTTIITESRSGREAWRASVFIDATGDGDLGAHAGCGWDIGLQGEGKSCPCQPMTLNALAMVKNARALEEFISFFRDDDMRRHVRATVKLKEELARAGVAASYGMPTLFHVRDNLLMVMLNHEYNVLPFDADGFTEATIRARAEVHRLVRGLESLGGPWEGMRVVATADQIGIRDGRRIHGLYTVGKQDLAEGRSFGDGVARIAFGVDIHAPTKEENDKRAIDNGDFRMRGPYEIPFRALIARDVDGLMMAGRCISGDHIAHASYRITGGAVAMGEAAGAGAALAARNGVLPRELSWLEVVDALGMARGAGANSLSR